ncbi:unnamed protein product [Chironomus riparius]|uniref:Gustatory receptor n=1 Tax=Chironomus riparius TaxID=315576 RepID=A0A9N9RZW4_9DIPT|nr:unnamed protein product [Chironomus riparius]
MIFEIHNIIVVFLQKSGAKFNVLCPDLIWMLNYLFLWSIVINSSVSASAVFNRIDSIGFKILSDIKDMDTESFHLIKAHLKKIRRSRRHFGTAFFDIDWRLLFGCFSTILTYIIITVQSDKSKYNAPSNFTSLF